MLLEHGMSAHAGKSKRIDSGAAGILGIAVNPGPRRGKQLEAAAGELRVGTIGTAGRRQETMVQRQSRFDQTGHPGGGHGVTDPRRDAAQDARSTDRRREHATQRAKLGAIGRRHARCKPLDEPDGRRIDPRGAIRPADRAGMALAARRREFAAPRGAGQANALEHGIDPITIALRRRAAA